MGRQRNNCRIKYEPGDDVLLLNVNKLRKSFGYGSLFDNLSFTLNEGEKISVVGANGCGKSTLLKIIFGLEKYDDGKVNIKKGAKIAYFDQNSSEKDDNRLVDYVLKDVYSELFEIQNKMTDIIEKINNEANPKVYNNLMNVYGELEEKFQSRNGYEIETNINIICNGLNISKKIRSNNYNKLSGGEKTLVELAKLLLQKPDLFLLDEPTNHLDIEKIEWLENYIKNLKSAAIIVSHDRKFLDNTSNKILEIVDGEGVIYNMNYSDYLIEKKKRFEKLMANWEDQQVYFKRLENQAKRMAQVGMATNSKSLTKKSSVLFNRIEREKQKFLIKQPEKNKQIKIKFDELPKTSKCMIELKNFSINANNKKIVDNINLCVRSKERIAIVGVSGSGKTSLIKAILNEQELPCTGEIIISPTIKIGYLPQIINFKNYKQTLLEYFQEQVTLNEEKARAILAKFQFYKEDISKKLKYLSSGEKIRLRLLCLLHQKINCLIFDEPTNHIDIPTKEALEESLVNFDGTLLFVSHDRFFINKFAEKIIEISHGKATLYLGNYQDYINKKTKEP